MFNTQFFKRNQLGIISDMSGQGPPSHAHRRRQRPIRGYDIFSKTHMIHVSCPIFKRNRLRMVSDMSEASKSCPSTSTTSTRPSPSSGYVIFSETHMVPVLYPIFKRNHLEWSQICQKPPSDAHRRRQYHLKWVRHYFKNTDGTCFQKNLMVSDMSEASESGSLTLSTSIFLEKLDIKHVPCGFLKI